MLNTTSTASKTVPPLKKASNPNDRIIGANIRRIRNERGLSQEILGNALGLTFQQVQKYEKGTNRVSGSRMAQLCHALNCTITDLFVGVDFGDKKAIAANQPSLAMGQSPLGLRMAIAFLGLSREMQLSMVGLAEELAAEQK